MTEDIHSCSYYCHKPECIKAQRDELRDKLAQSKQCTYPNCDYPCMNLPDCKQPEQKLWIGLTDREKSNLWLESRAAIPRFHTYATLVEAKLKVKNI
jgi:hypothetical protein